MKWTSPNFAFLEPRDPLLHKYASLAEHCFAEDPNGAAVKMRQFAEALTHATDGALGGSATTADDFLVVLRRLDPRVPERVVALLHELRKLGNRAVHGHVDRHGDALTALKIGHQIAAWYHATFRVRGFKPDPFVVPPNPAEATAALVAELGALRQEAAETAARLAAVEGSAAELDRLRAAAESKAARAYADLDAAMALASESEQARAEMRVRFQADLAAVQAPPTSAPPPVVADVAQAAITAADALDVGEATTRKLIDEQLRKAGWEADTQVLRWSKGTRPQRGKNLALAEVPTDSGPVDYVLFRGLVAVAIVEAKREAKNVPGVLKQSERYASDIRSEIVGNVGGPWGEFRIPFAFSTNGRPYLEQLKTMSGIWFRDLRAETNLSRALMGWWSPEQFDHELGNKPGEATSKLKAEPFDDLGLRDYQIDVIEKVEAAIGSGRRNALVAMATGTGKTRTALGLIYRALKSKRFRRVLFLVDRTSLGDQTYEVVGQMAVDGNQTLASIYGVKGLGEGAPDAATRLHLATVQSLARQVIYADEPPPVDQYDLIVVDECHRGYSLDRELSEDELTFRNEQDYVSKYRRVLDYFDAVKVGLTATPAPHTVQIFGKAVATYSYRQAVIDGRLIDHEPPWCIKTEKAEDGVNWKRAEFVQRVHIKTGLVDSEAMDDDTRIDVDGFNTQIFVPGFNKVVCEELAKYLDPALPGKTLVFCARDAHADEVVAALKTALETRWGPIPNRLVEKITGEVDDPLRAIRFFKNEPNPKIVVTVDLLTTGIDVPEISNIVFLRRVRSRILYEQMLGRATRRCDSIGKEVFRVFDCVDLYAALEPFTNMKPVVRTVSGSLRSIIEDLSRLRDPVIKSAVRGEFLAAWERRRGRLRGQALIDFEAAVGMQVGAVAGHVKVLTLDDASTWLSAHIDAFVVVDGIKPPSDPTMWLDPKPDTHRGTIRGYGEGRRPEDYLEGFRNFIATHMNEIPALAVVLQRPRELTRKQLKEVALALDAAGYPEVSVQTAWGEVTSQQVGARIIGHIRRAALGSPLLSYEERVDRGLAKILASRTWTGPQVGWLKRFSNQLKVQTVLDRESLDEGQFKMDGGHARINRVFDGQVDEVIAGMTDALWADTA